MSDTSWILKGVDPEVREQATEEAARQGVSLSDYLANALLRSALNEQVEDESIEPETILAPPRSAPVDTASAPRHRLDAVERRLGLAVGTFESATQALDTSLVELAARVDETEAVASETSEALVETVQEIGANLNALRKRLADAEDITEALGEASEAAHEGFNSRCDTLDERLQIVDTVARGAEKAAADLALAQDALKQAVAQDFSDFARETTDRLTAGLSDVQDAADAAASQADAAVAHLIQELRGVRAHLEQSQADSATETRARMQAAFNETTEQLGAIALRVAVNERATDQLRAQIADVEDGAQTALEETAETLRQAGAALAAEFARATQDTRSSLESVHGDLANEIAELRERQVGEAARIKLLDAGAGAAANDIAAIRQVVGLAIGDISTIRAALGETDASVAALSAATSARLASADETTLERLGQLRAEITTRFDAVALREDERQRIADESLAAFQLETERIEACTLAALEQLNKNFTAADSALDARLDARLAQVESATDTLIAQVAERLEGQIAELRDSHTGATAHLKIIDRTIGSQNLDSIVATAISPVREQMQRLDDELRHRPVDRMFSNRLDQLEAAASRGETDQAVTALKAQVDAIALHLRALHLDDGAAQRIDDLRARLTTIEGKSGESADRVQGVVQLLGRVASQSTETATQADERLHKVEIALADMRLDRLGADTSGPSALEAVADVARRMAELEERHTRAARADATRPSALDAVGEIARRMAALEERQAEVLVALQTEISHFIGENDQRFKSLEARGASGGGDPGIAQSFEALRVSVEERILGIELRSVRTLEQVADTVAMLEERLMGADLLPDAAREAG